MGTIRINVVGLPKGSSLKADQDVVIDCSTREIECEEAQPFTLTYTPPPKPQPRCILCGAQEPCIVDYTTGSKFQGCEPFWACGLDYGSPLKYGSPSMVCHSHLTAGAFWMMVRAVQAGYIDPCPLPKVRK